MDTNKLKQLDEYTWRIDAHGAMRVPLIFYADEALIR